MKKETLKSLIRVLQNTVSKDPTNQALNHAVIYKDKIIGCDGHILSEVKIDEPLFETVDKIFIHRDNLPYLKLIAKNNDLEIPATLFNPCKLSIEGRDVSASEVNYPNWQNIIPKYEETVKIGLDADLLLSLVKSMTDDKKKHCSIEIKVKKDYFKDDREPIITGIDNTCPFIVKSFDGQKGILMPVRV